MVKIRLARHGKRNDPHYRVVAIDERKKGSAMPIAVLGFWHPLSKEVKVDKKGISEWVKKGAIVTEGVKKLL